MITVGMNYNVIAGKEQEFEDKFAGVIGALEAAEGHDSSTLWKDVSNGSSYLITSEWNEEQAFTDFIRKDEELHALSRQIKNRSPIHVLPESLLNPLSKHLLTVKKYIQILDSRADYLSLASSTLFRE